MNSPLIATPAAGGAGSGGVPAPPPTAATGTGQDASLLLRTLFFLSITLPSYLIRGLIRTITVLLSVIQFILSPVVTLLAPYLSPRHISLSISFDLLGLFKGLAYIAIGFGIYYLWRYTWGGRYTRLPPATEVRLPLLGFTCFAFRSEKPSRRLTVLSSKPCSLISVQVLKFPPSSLTPPTDASTAAAQGTEEGDVESDSEEDPEHKLRKLADLLSGIKVFKYLDSHIFFELLKGFSTQTFEAGETIFSGDGQGTSEGDLLIVISGTVDLFLKNGLGDEDASGSMSGWATPSMGRNRANGDRTRTATSNSSVAALNGPDGFPDALSSQMDSGEDIHAHPLRPKKEKDRRSLLRTVGPGSTVSSLFEIMAVFAGEEDVTLSTMPSAQDSVTPTEDTESPETPTAAGLGLSTSSSAAGSFSPNLRPPGRFPTPQLFPPNDAAPQQPPTPTLYPRKLLPNLSAVARTATALAVLPASAISSMPARAKSALVQVIVARFQRTVGVVYDYLGMGGELWGVLSALNQVPSTGPLVSLPYPIMDKLRAVAVPFATGKASVVKVRPRPRSFHSAHSTASSMEKRATFDVSDADDGEEDDDEGDEAMRGLLSSMKKLNPPQQLQQQQLRPSQSPTPVKAGASSTDIEVQDIRTVKAVAYAALCATLGAPEPAEPAPEEAEVLGVSPNVVMLRQGKHPPGMYIVVDGTFEVAAMSGRAPLRNFTSVRTAGSANEPSHHQPLVDLSIWDPIRLYGTGERRHISFAERPLGAQDLAEPEDADGEATESDRPKTRLAKIAEMLRKRERRVLGDVGAGCVLGYFPVITGHPSFSTVTAKTTATVVYFPRAVIERIVDRNPRVLSWFSFRMLAKLPSLSLYTDLAIDWLQLRASQVVCRQGAKPDAIYVVLNGRLRSIFEREQSTSNSGKTPFRGSGTGWATLLETGDDDDRHDGPLGGLQFLLSGLANTFAPRKFNKDKKPAAASSHVRRTVNFEVLGEFGQGDSFGEAEVVTDRPVPATVHAIRDSEVAVVPTTLFDALAVRHPEIMVQLSRIIATSATRGVGTPEATVFPMTNFVPERGLSNTNLKTVAIVPVNGLVPVQEFAERLRDALMIEGATAAVLNTAAVLGVLGKHAFTRFGKLKLSSWLAEQEETSRMVLYVADGQPTAPWTQRCIRQADAILVVGLGDEDPAVGEYEKLLSMTTARKDLVLLHNERFVIQGSTAEWLKQRSWVNAHHHIQMHVPYRNVRGLNRRRNPTLLDDLTSLLRPSSIINNHTLPARPIFSRLKSFDSFEPSLLATIGQIDVQTNQITSDFRRIARRLLAKTVGLVLGGGGARGLAHVGMIKAFEEAGIEFDMIGGTSQGAYIGGILAREGNSVAVMARAKSFATQMSSTMQYLLDVWVFRLCI